MTSARTMTLASLRGVIDRIEAMGMSHEAQRVALGHEAIDATLQGGLQRSALHEVFATETRHAASAAGFAAGVAARVGRGRPLLWVRQDFVDRECGTLSMTGFAELGLDPRRVVLVRAADAEIALRLSADALACDALGAVVLDLWGEVRAFDAVASRKLTLAAQTSGVTCLMLRTSARPAVSTAETRWIVRAAHSPPGPESSAWGAPVFDTELIRNRHGQTGQWLMEWNCDECLFRDPEAHSQPVAAAPAHRPHQAAPPASHRLAGTRRAG